MSLNTEIELHLMYSSRVYTMIFSGLIGWNEISEGIRAVQIKHGRVTPEDWIKEIIITKGILKGREEKEVFRKDFINKLESEFRSLDKTVELWELLSILKQRDGGEDRLAEAVANLFYFKKNNSNNFGAELYVLFVKADLVNRAKLRQVYPYHDLALRLWDEAGDQGDDLFKEYNLISTTKRKSK